MTTQTSIHATLNAGSVYSLGISTDPVVALVLRAEAPAACDYDGRFVDNVSHETTFYCRKSGMPSLAALLRKLADEADALAPKAEQVID